MARYRCLVPALTLLLAHGCTGPPDARKGGNHAAAPSEGTVRVVFSLPGDDIGSPETAAALEMIKGAIVGRNVGEIVSAGFGMGKMELVVKLRGAGSLPVLEEIIRARYPAAKYRIAREGQ